MPDFEDELYSNPEAAVDKKIAAAFEAGRQSLTQEVNKRFFWEQFYRNNRDLEPDRDLVSAVLKDNHEELLPLDVPTAIDRLAELSRERIEKNVRRQARQREYSVMKGGPGMDPGESHVAYEEGDYSMTGTIKRRRQQMREAHSNFITRRAE